LEETPGIPGPMLTNPFKNYGFPTPLLKQNTRYLKEVLFHIVRENGILRKGYQVMYSKSKVTKEGAELVVF
jgi:hypothetical protein